MNRGSMMRAAALVLVLLATTGIVGAAERGAAVRKPVRYVADDAVGDPVEWTKRFVGRFRMDGSIHHESEIMDYSRTRDADARVIEVWDVPLRGKGDCIDFTAAAGLQCVLNVFWLEQWRENMKDQLGGVPDLTPGMLLAGLVPSTAPGRIQMLEVDQRGIAHPGAVELHGFTAKARPPCVNMPGTMNCEQILTITARPDSKLIFLTLVIRVQAIRSKLERKRTLDVLDSDPPRFERNMELLEERLTVSLSLRREPQLTEATPAPADRPAQGSR